MMTCHARHYLTVCASQGPCWHATPNVVRPYVLSKGDDGMPNLMSFISVFCQMVKIACHAKRRLTECVVLGQDGMPRPR